MTKLQGHVSRLRRELVQLGGPDAANVVQTKHPGYVLCQHRTSTDAAQFDQLLRRAPDADLAERAAQLAAALDLWRGPACVDVETSAVRSMSTVLDERRMRAVETLAELRLDSAEYDEVIDSLHRLVREAPYRERAWEVLLPRLPGTRRRGHGPGALRAGVPALRERAGHHARVSTARAGGVGRTSPHAAGGRRRRTLARSRGALRRLAVD